MMLDLAGLLEQIRTHCESETKNHIDLIVEQNSRVENYFTVLIIILLEKLKTDNKIIDYKFQYLLNTQYDKRQHIDFLLIGKYFKAYLEIKHLVIDTIEKTKNNRTINFYTSKSDEGKKVGIVGDLEKLNKIKSNDVTDFISLSIITNSPKQKVIDERIKFVQNYDVSKNWDIKSHMSDSIKLSFIVCHKTSTK